MPGVEVTLTYALPVCAEALAAQVKAQIVARPTLHQLRLCNRFGSGRFSDLPAELVQMIEGYFVKQVHEEVTKELDVASRCFKNECSILDHADRSTLLEMYARCTTTLLPHDSKDFFDDPNDEQLVQALESGHNDYLQKPMLEYDEEEGAHQTNRFNWPELVREIFSQSNRRAFRKSFGLDIWSSFVSLPDDDGSLSDGIGFPRATIAYHTLPKSVKRRHEWSGSLREEMDGDTFYEHPSAYGENGLGMAVNINRRPSALALSKFPQALNVLKLEVFVHPSQKQLPALRLGPKYEHKKPDVPNTSETPGESLIKQADIDQF